MTCRACQIRERPPPREFPEYAYLAAVSDAILGTPHGLCELHKASVEHAVNRAKQLTERGES